MKRRIITLVSAAIIAVLTIATGSAYAAGPAGNLDQCANGPSGTVNCTDGAWQNGNLNDNQANYFEGDSVPYRLKLTDLGPGTHNVTIEWDTTKSGKHAFDYLTNYNRTETTADPCSSAGFTCSGPNTTFPIPVDPNVAKGQDGVSGTSDDITQIPGVFTLFGGTITGVSGYTLTGTYSGDSATSITITFTTNASVPNLVLAWGGHVSTRINWGSGNSSVAIPGSPWHMRFIDLDGKGGNQDRSLSSAAVIFPGSITITKNAIPDSLTQFGFTASPLPLTNFILVDNGATANTTTVSNIINFTTYNVAESVPTGWTLTNIGCTVISPNGGTQTVSIPEVSIHLKEGEFVTCTFHDERQQATLTLNKVVVNDNGGTNVPADWTLNAVGPAPSSNVALSGQGTVSGQVEPGTYTLSESTVPGYAAGSWSCTGGAQNGNSIALDPGQNATCTITNDDIQPVLTVIKHVINDNGGTNVSGDFTMSVAGNNVAPASFAGAESGTTVTLDAGSYSVNETGPFGYDTSFSTDCTGSIAVGETKTCTVTNDDQFRHLSFIKAGALNITGKNLDYTINVTNDGAVNLNIVNITDPTSALTCDITYPKLLAPGESISCTVSYPAETPINATTVIELANPDIILRV